MKQLLATAALGLLLSACQAVGPDYTLPETSAINRGDLQGQLAGEGTNVVSAPVPADWWKLYNDPRLDELVRQAMASNTDLRVAAANLQRARFQTQEAESAGGWSAGCVQLVARADAADFGGAHGGGGAGDRPGFLRAGADIHREDG